MAPTAVTAVHPLDVFNGMDIIPVRLPKFMWRPRLAHGIGTLPQLFQLQQNLLPVQSACHAKVVSQISVGEEREQLAVHLLGGKCPRILPKPNGFQPFCYLYLVHVLHAMFRPV
jgi:hypothetical protein